ncbi:MAG: DUF58 domain-containing protein [Alphaproteobacteria bacterium]
MTTTQLSTAERLAGSFPPLLAAAERIANTVLPGGHGRRRVGQGDAFWQYRGYQGGDPIRRIDWRRSARGSQVYVRETEWEAAQTVWFWADQSPSMDYASDRDLTTKAERGAVLMLAMASLLGRGGERIALMADTDAPDLRPGMGRMALLRLADEVQRRRADAKAGLPIPDCVGAHSHALIVGDLLSPLDEIERLARALTDRRARGHFIQVLDPAELDLPFRGRTRFEGLEDEGSLLVRRAESLRTDYVDRIEAHVEGVRTLARNAGWTYALHVTGQSAQSAVLAAYTAIAGG